MKKGASDAVVCLGPIHGWIQIWPHMEERFTSRAAYRSATVMDSCAIPRTRPSVLSLSASSRHLRRGRCGAAVGPSHGRVEI